MRCAARRAAIQREPVGWGRRPNSRCGGAGHAAGAGLAIDGGELPGVPSTVVDLRSYEVDGRWRIVRQGVVESEAVAGSLGSNE